MASVVSDKFFAQQIFKPFPISIDSNHMTSSQYEFDCDDDQFNEETCGFENEGHHFDMSSRQLVVGNEDNRQNGQCNDGTMQNCQGAVHAFYEMQQQSVANAFHAQMSGQLQSAVQHFGFGYMNSVAPTGSMGIPMVTGGDQSQKSNFGMNQFSTHFQQPNLLYGNLATVDQQQGSFLTQHSFNQANQLWMTSQTNQNQSPSMQQGMAMNSNHQATLLGNDFMGDFADTMVISNNIPNEEGTTDLSFQRVLHKNISGAMKGVSGSTELSSQYNNETVSGGFAQKLNKELKQPFMFYSQGNHIESRGILLTKPSEDVEDDMPDLARPKRPLTAYNLFFKEERAKIVQEQAAENEHHTSDGVKRNRRKEPHGKIGFEAMAKTIAERWKTIDPERLAVFNQRADEGKKQYRKAIAEYNRKRKALQKKSQQETFS